jgi:hypothetical protein
MITPTHMQFTISYEVILILSQVPGGGLTKLDPEPQTRWVQDLFPS